MASTTENEQFLSQSNSFQETVDVNIIFFIKLNLYSLTLIPYYWRHKSSPQSLHHRWMAQFVLTYNSCKIIWKLNFKFWQKLTKTCNHMKFNYDNFGGWLDDIPWIANGGILTKTILPAFVPKANKAWPSLVIHAPDVCSLYVPAAGCWIVWLFVDSLACATLQSANIDANCALRPISCKIL